MNKYSSYIKHFSLTLLTAFFVQLAFAQTSPVMDYAKAKEYELAGVKVEGTKFLDDRVLITLSGLTIGEKIKVPGEDVAKAIKQLWKQKLFTNVAIETDRIEGEKIYLNIILEERPRLSRYNIKGVKNSDLDELKKKLDVRAGSIFTDNIKMTSVHQIKQYFIDKGYLNTQVEVRELRDTVFKNSVHVQYFVDKGEIVKIKEITFEGATAFTNVQLRSKMKDTKEKVKFDLPGIFRFKKNFQTEPNHPRWYQVIGNFSPIRSYEYLSRFINPNIFKASRFKRKEYEDDKKKVLDYYLSKGYRDARIVSDTVYKLDQKNLAIRLRVDEGRQYYFRNIEWRGNTKYSDSLLSRILGVKRGDIYSTRALEEKLFQNPNGGDVSSLYMDDGYLFFNVTPTEIKVDGDSIDVAMVINEGQQATIRDVRIMGNTKTNEQVIRRELYTLPGSKFSRADLIRSQRQIVNLGYFDPQQLDVIPVPNPENGTVDIEYRVTEKPSDQLELSAGYGGQAQGFVGTLGVTFSNFSLRNMFDKKAWSPLPSGDGQRLSLRFQSSGKRSQFYTVSFTEPWLGGKKPTSLTVAFNRTQINNLDYNVTNYPVIGKYAATAVTLGLGTRLKRPDDFFTFEAALTYQNYLIDNYPGYFPLFSNGQAHNLNLSLNLSRNSVDAPLYPKHGTNFSLTASATLPYSLMFNDLKNLNYESDSLPANQRYKMIEFWKVRMHLDWYTSIWKNLVFKASVKMGFQGYYNARIGNSPFERFELGGDGISNFQVLGKDIISLRGYPVITQSTGATIFNKFSMEVRYPISLNPSATIFVLGFMEAGNAWYSFKEYKPYQLNRSAGIGVRVFLPMFGLLGVDYGFPLDKLFDTNGTRLDNPKGAPRIILGQEPE
ncbi:MAG: outer membrane protein assembly factor [Chitinophagales bacterium]|nr:outer membrane protein assembly factor [Chitinophagales bacterium]